MLDIFGHENDLILYSEFAESCKTFPNQKKLLRKQMYGQKEKYIINQ